MAIDWTAVVTGMAAPAAILVVKWLLDLSLAQWFVKHLSVIPVRGITRERPPRIAGKWRQVWGAGGSPNFANETDRHSYAEIKQFGSYVYAEFDAKDGEYAFFGRIREGYVVAEWYDRKDRNAYFGTAQLRILSSQELEGCYLGHSRRTALVGADSWVWKKHC